MRDRYVSTARAVFGVPYTFGWTRWAALDQGDLAGWERPDGLKVRIPHGAQLARIRGSAGPPIFFRDATSAVKSGRIAD
jgi:hypothetical protein